MASGLQRCMYCEDSQGTDIDHFDPKSRTPIRAFDWSNLLLACSFCNSNAKRSQFPVDPATDTPLLVDPTSDDPLEHLSLSPTTGAYFSIGPKGQPTIDVFGLNRYVCEEGRRNAVIVIGTLSVAYANSKKAGHAEKANKLLSALFVQPFQGVRVVVSGLIASGKAEGLIAADVIGAFEDNSELSGP
jgi:uncharacterized protein (TIGR02646 family)